MLAVSVRWTRGYVRHLLQFFRRRAPDIHVLVLLACVSHLLLTAPLSFRSALYVDVTELQTNFAPCQRVHFTHCSYLRAGSLGAWRHAHLPFGRGCRLRGALASGVQPEACQAQRVARARDEVFSLQTVCRRLTEAPATRASRRQKGFSSASPWAYEPLADLAAWADVVVQSLRAAPARADAMLNAALLELAG